MIKRALIILADGFEETEAVGPIDILRRAGVDVTIAGLSGKEISGGHGIKVLADKTLDDVSEEYDALILPGGGGGADNLSRSEKVKTLIREMNDKGKIVAAICASPAVVLSPTGILNKKRATCYPGMEDAFPADTVCSKNPVVVDGNIITSRGPGTALLFGIKLAELLVGKDKADDVRKGMLI
ncbi:MAG: DJ-1 family glyoxalase III [Candidatus Omnitrophota bacterium]